MYILFLCKGNVGRSQMAEALFNYYYPQKGYAFSAGTALSGPEQTLESLLPGTENVIAAMKEEGIDVSQCTRKQVTDIILEKSKAHKVILLTTEPTPEILLGDERLECWGVADPKGMSLEDTRKVRDQIKEKVTELANSI